MAAAMISFVNPDLLGNLATFKRVFAEPISKSRERNANAEEQALGTERSKWVSWCLLLAIQLDNTLNTGKQSPINWKTYSVLLCWLGKEVLPLYDGPLSLAWTVLQACIACMHSHVCKAWMHSHVCRAWMRSHVCRAWMDAYSCMPTPVQHAACKHPFTMPTSLASLDWGMRSWYADSLAVMSCQSCLSQVFLIWAHDVT